MTDTRAALSELLVDVARTLHIQRPLAAFDVESTGTNPELDRIVELTIGRIEPDLVTVQVLHTRINPGIPIPEEASAIHGITNADVADAPSFAKVARLVVSLLQDADLAGYNHRRFDVRLIGSELARVGLPTPCDNARMVDAQLIFFKREPRDLSAAHRLYYGEALEGAHGTTADVVATLRRWMLDKDFPPDAKEIARNALRGTFPVRQAAATPELEPASAGR